jgi:hypothetical protein
VQDAGGYFGKGWLGLGNESWLAKPVCGFGRFWISQKVPVSPFRRRRRIDRHPVLRLMRGQRREGAAPFAEPERDQSHLASASDLPRRR